MIVVRIVASPSASAWSATTTLRAAAPHGFRYDPAGQCFKTPCNGPAGPISKALRVKTYHTREVNGFIWLWWGTAEVAELPPLPWIDELPPNPSAGLTRSEYWPFNYARILENNLDAHHWAFVHGSIMVGVGEHVDDYHVGGRRRS